MSAPAVEISGLCKTYRRHVWPLGAHTGDRGVQDITLTVAPGEAWLIAGPNGAGKTTTMHCILGLLRPTSGRVRIFGQPPEAARASMGYQPDVFFTYPFLTARQTLQFYGGLAGMAAQPIAQRTQWLLGELDLLGAIDRKVGTFSKGMLQRLGLAQSILHDPQIILWDEPTGGLDPSARQNVLALARALKAAGKTVLLSTHILGDVEDVCDHLAIISAGRCRLAGPMAALMAQGRHDSLNALYAAAMAASQGGPHA